MGLLTRLKKSQWGRATLWVIVPCRDSASAPGSVCGSGGRVKGKHVTK